jgi:hypothetical protein
MINVDFNLLPWPEVQIAPFADDSENTENDSPGEGIGTNKKRGRAKMCENTPTIRCLCRNETTVLRRAWSETKLLDVLDHDFLPGHAYHCISGGDVDSLSYLTAILRRQNLDYCLFSTWCLAKDDILQMHQWLIAGRIKRLDAYVGEIFPNTYRHEWAMLQELFAAHNPDGRVAVFKNHSKIFAGSGSAFDFAIESSANINTNPRTENTNITIGTDIYQFYKEFFDGIKPFNKDYPNWQPWGSKGKI